MQDNEHLIPQFSESLEEELVKLMEDLKYVNTSKNVDNMIEILFKVLSSDEDADLSTLDKLIPELVLPDEILEFICVLVLKNINFNFEYFLYKSKIHEKQKFKLQECISRMNHCCMNNFRNILSGFLNNNVLLDTAKHIRIYVCYCVLENMTNDTKNSSSLEFKGRFNDLKPLDSNNPQQLSFFDLKNNASFECINTIEAIKTKDLNENKVNGDKYFYEGGYDIFYCIEYIIYNDIYILERWIKNQKVFCSWKLLGVSNDKFILNEIKHIKDINFLCNLILKTKCHYLIHSFLIRLIKNLKFSKAFMDLVVLSYDDQYISNTTTLFDMLYKEDKMKTNILLKEVIIKYKTSYLKNLFFNNYDIIGFGYLQCLKVFIKDIDSVNENHFRDLLKLSYFHILVEDYDDFIIVFDYLEKKNMLDLGIKNVHRSQWEFNITNINKIKYLYLKYKIDNGYFKDILVTFIDLLYKKKVEYNSLMNLLKMYINQEQPHKKNLIQNSETISFCNKSKAYDKRTEVAFDEPVKQASRNNSEITEVINLTCPERNNTLNTSSDNSGSNIANSYNNTINIPLRLNRYETKYVENKKYLIKKETYRKIKNICKCTLTEENIKGIIDLYFIYRNEYLSKKIIKRIYHIDPDVFIQKIIDSEKFDAFLVQNINTIADDQFFFKYLDKIRKLIIFKKNNYWNIAIRNRLRLPKRFLLQEGSKKTCENKDLKKNEKRLKETENLLGLYNTKDISVKESNVDLSVISSKNCRNDLFENSQVLHISNTTTFFENILDGDMYSSTLNASTIKTDADKPPNKQIKKEIVSLLSIETLYKLLSADNCKNSNIIKKEINNRTKYPTGLCFNDSYIKIKCGFKSFILNFTVYQYSIEGEQYILEIENENESFRLGTYNGKLYQELEYNVKNNRKIERKLLTLDCTYLNELYVECKYKKGKMHMTLLNKIYIINLSKVEIIIICRKFKGIMNKLILHEFTSYNSSRLTNLDKSNLYIKVLQKLERYLVYNNMKGVFIDSYVPYFFNEKIDIEFYNIIESTKYT